MLAASDIHQHCPPRHHREVRAQKMPSGHLGFTITSTSQATQNVKSPRRVQRFLSTDDQRANVFSRRRDHDTAVNLRSNRTQAFATWVRW
jgi:hypothetical protein